MKPEDFKAWRKKMKFTQQQAADVLGLYRLTVVNYERGERLGIGSQVKIPRSVDLACAALAAGLKPFSEQEQEAVRTVGSNRE